jgi:hypothetical protein
LLRTLSATFSAFGVTVTVTVGRGKGWRVTRWPAEVRPSGAPTLTPTRKAATATISVVKTG